MKGNKTQPKKTDLGGKKGVFALYRAGRAPSDRKEDQRESRRGEGARSVLEQRKEGGGMKEKKKNFL